MNSQDFPSWPEPLVQKFRKLGVWNDKNLFSLLQESAEKWPEHLAVVDEASSRTYSELLKNSLRLAMGLRNKGVTAGDKVILQLPNSCEFVEVFFALLFLGANPIMALPAHRKFELCYFAQHAQAKIYITTDSHNGFCYADLASELLSETSIELAVIHTKSDKISLGHEMLDLKSLYCECGAQSKISPLTRKDDQGLALLQLSGGTTSVPKLIPRTHNDYFYSVRKSAEICELNRETVFLCVLPCAHNFTLSSPGVLGVLFAGGTVVMTNSVAVDAIFPDIEKYKVTMTALVPPVAISWMSALDNCPSYAEHLQSLQLIQVGGAKLSAEVAKRIQPIFGAKLQQVFGMAEGLVNYTRIGDDEEIVLHTQGRPLSEFDEVKVVDDDDRELPFGEVGHLLTRGPYTIRGYYKAPEVNQKSFTLDGFYRTGDIVCLNDQGYISVEGRDKDQINRGGEKISAEEVENQLLAHNDVLDVAVVATPDDYLGEKICACLILTNMTSPLRLLKNVRKYLRERGLADYKFPDSVVLLDEFPITSFGKTSKKALRALLTNDKDKNLDKKGIPSGNKTIFRTA